MNLTSEQRPMKWPEGVRKCSGGYRAVIVLDDGPLDLGVWGLKPDAIEAYNTHVAWRGIDRPLLHMPRDEAQEFFDRFKFVAIGHRAGRKFPARVVRPSVTS
jgi:hypothetical protein